MNLIDVFPQRYLCWTYRTFQLGYKAKIGAFEIKNNCWSFGPKIDNRGRIRGVDPLLFLMNGKFSVNEWRSDTCNALCISPDDAHAWYAFMDGIFHRSLGSYSTYKSQYSYNDAERLYYFGIRMYYIINNMYKPYEFGVDYFLKKFPKAAYTILKTYFPQYYV